MGILGIVTRMIVSGHLVILAKNIGVDSIMHKATGSFRKSRATKGTLLDNTKGKR